MNKHNSKIVELADEPRSCGVCGGRFELVSMFEAIAIDGRLACATCAARECPGLVATIHARAPLWPGDYFGYPSDVRAAIRQDVLGHTA